MDSDELVRMFAEIEARRVNLHSLLIVRHGALVTEAYFQPYSPETEHTIESLTKSILGTLVGIAIDQGKLESADQKLVDFFPERTIANLDNRKKNITIANLLALDTGLDCSDFAPPASEMWESPDWVQFMLDLPMKNDPGKQWSYCTGAVHLLSAILQKATGQDPRLFANEHLFKPLGIPAVPVEAWMADPQGLSFGGAGLYLTPRDVAKYALLYLTGGQWEGRQIVSRAWVETSTRPHAYAGNDPNFGAMPRDYGYLWSLFPAAGFYSALGMGGQHIHIVPEQDLAVVITAAEPVNSFHFSLIQNYILPAVKSDGPLAENSAGAAQLKDRVQTAADPLRPVPPLPEAASMASGKTYSFAKENVLGWDTLEVAFSEGSETAMFIINNSLEAAIGLDGVYRELQAVGDRALWGRGAWEDGDTFAVETCIPGTLEEQLIRLTFNGVQVTVTSTHRVHGGLVRMVGKAGE
jgi:CubicO group peptidase (beta-lactamase class C family)